MTSNDNLSRILRHALTLTGKLERRSALQYFVHTAQELTGAEICALGVLDSRGDIAEFVQVGMSDEQAELIQNSSIWLDLTASTAGDSAFYANDVTLPSPYSHVQASDFAKLHEKNAMDVPVIVHDQVWGHLHLGNKPGGFNQVDADNMELLAQAASIAVQNSRLYVQAQNRARWMAASQKIASSLLEGTDEEEALQVITEEMRVAAGADVSLMVLPSIQDAWVCEFVAGKDAGQFLGITFPPSGRAQTVIREQAGIVVDSMQRISTVRVSKLRQFGPALYAPLVSHGEGRGVIILLRNTGAPEFDLHDLSMAENAAQQAALALELAQARYAAQMAAELDERARISQDLHDLAIQQLFASGMHITAVREDLESRQADPETLASLDDALTAIDESVSQIRQIVHSLRDESSPEALVDRLEHESHMALQSLGYAPSLVITYNGTILPDDGDITVIDNAVGSDIADDVVAVVREGLSNAARHARASSVSVSIAVDQNSVTIDVIDDGAGLAPSPSRRSGLSNLAARALRHHGVFRMTSREDGVSGTHMHWEVPLR